jgi:acetyl-CoA acyltransferase
MPEALVVDALRTASGRGKMGGALSGWHPADLLATVIRTLVDRSRVDPAEIDDVVGGCVMQVGEQSVNITRTAVLAAGLPESVPGTTLDRQCGSSQQAMHFAAQGIMSGQLDLVIACGVELMSRVPMGTSTLGQDPLGHLLHERYPDGLVNQGVSAELIASRWSLGRDRLDGFAAESHRRAAEATAKGWFDREILPVSVPSQQSGAEGHRCDETVRAGTTVEGLAGLRASFQTAELSERFPEIGWHITPGNSSPLTDGASAVMIASDRFVERNGLPARARFHSGVVTGSDPLTMLTGPIPATRRLLDRTGLTIDDIDAFEVNEAFAPVPLAWLEELHADPERTNPRGGAIALGHALGSSGTRLLTTMLHQLEDTDGRFGLQTMCEGGGMANAMIVERL